MKVGNCSVCGKEDVLGIDDRCKNCLEQKPILNGCGSKNGEEVDGWEFEVDNLKDFIEVLKTYKSIHLNYFDDEEDLDLWLRLEN